ncbi:MAG: DUF421 domain-containing protein [Bacteroidia bacterium]
MNSYLEIILRSAAVYLCIVVFIRIFGKKELSQLSITDLVFILLISNAVQNAMVGNDSTLSGGLIAAVTLFSLNSIIRFLVFKFKPVQNFLEGEAIILIYKGTVLEKNLKKERITMEELKSTVREHGVEKISEVDLAVLEMDGNISVLSDNFAHQTSKKRKHHKVLNQNQ